MTLTQAIAQNAITQFAATSDIPTPVTNVFCKKKIRERTNTLIRHHYLRLFLPSQNKQQAIPNLHKIQKRDVDRYHPSSWC